MKSTKILKCKNTNCISKWQDFQYGVGMRLMNLCKPTKDIPEKDKTYRCCICGKEQ